MFTYEWKNWEDRILRDDWAAGIDASLIAAKLHDRSTDAVSRRAGHLGLERPSWYRPNRPHGNWDLIEAVLRESEVPLEAPEIAELVDLKNSVVYRQLQLRRGKLVRVADWRITTRKPAAKWALGSAPDMPSLARGKKKAQPNPFAALLGVSIVPTAPKGRVFIHLTDSKEDEMEIAA
jgi:hypothetical protein